MKYICKFAKWCTLGTSDIPPVYPRPPGVHVNGPTWCRSSVFVDHRGARTRSQDASCDWVRAVGIPMEECRNRWRNEQGEEVVI